MKEFTGKVAVVTGAASGIGYATATKFAEEGMRVVLADIEVDTLNKAVTALTDAGHEVIGVPTDVSKWDAIQALADKTMSAFGAVHVVHNNAGVVVSGPIEQLSIEDWEWVFGVDLWSVIYGIKAFLPLIKQSGEGHIVNTASIAGLHSSPGIGPYNAAKFGVVALTETLRRELDSSDTNVSASVLCPGAVNTRIVESDRNRDPESAKTHQASDVEKNFTDFSSKLLSQHGLAPTDVADMVLQAIHNNEFWILTHPEWRDLVAERVKALRENNMLNSMFGS
ncbi:MAG: SDR family NAD(P)-dependent oxidoreductase [Pseudomonadota bacterium]